MPADLSNVIALQVTSISEKPNGGAQISVEVPDISRYPFPLHLNADQAQALDGPGEYKVFLVQGRLKDGKDGSWQSDYWYNVFSFNGVVDERNRPTESDEPTEDRQQPTPPKVAPQPQVAPPVQAPSATGLIKEEELSHKDRIIVQEIALKLAFEQTSGDTLEEHVYNASLLYPKILDVFYGRFKTSPLVEEASKQGAKIVDIKTKEEPLFEPEESSLDNTQWDYKKPQGLVSYAEFVMYVKNCGWIMEDVIKWLGMEVEAYVSQAGKGYMTAAKLCKDKALEQGLEPPFDFRQEKKEAK
mgnify:CR=1 FL=1